MPKTSRRRAALRGLSRLRTSVKRAHNLLNLMLPEMDAWRDRILELERADHRRERELTETLDAEQEYLLTAAAAA